MLKGGYKVRARALAQSRHASDPSARAVLLRQEVQGEDMRRQRLQHQPGNQHEAAAGASTSLSQPPLACVCTHVRLGPSAQSPIIGRPSVNFGMQYNQPGEVFKLGVGIRVG
jgi:hypothetical protein